jgi:hypothetical protein
MKNQINEKYLKKLQEDSEVIIEEKKNRLL